GTQARIVRCPVGDLVSLLRNVMPAVAVGFERHGRRPSTIEGSPPHQPTRGRPPRRPVQQRDDPHVVGSMAAHIVLPWTHRVFANLKRWALGVYHGLRRKHLQTYLDEFVFRFNRRRARHAAFRSLLCIAAVHSPLSYNMLILPE